MVPNPVSGLATVGMGHDAGPCPWLQSVGATDVDCGVLVGLQICQKTLDDDPPETLAVNWTALFTRIVTLLTVALELAAVTVTATGVEFDAQPPAHKVRSISSVPSPAAFMSLPPSNPRLNIFWSLCGGRSRVVSNGLRSFIRMSGSLRIATSFFARISSGGQFAWTGLDSGSFEGPAQSVCYRRPAAANCSAQPEERRRRRAAARWTW